MKRLRNAIVGAVQFRRKQEDISHTALINLLKQDLRNGPYHVFGDHRNCKAYFCNISEQKTSEKNWVPELQECGYFQDIVSYTNRLYYNASSLLYNMTNNEAEHYNSVLVKFTGGKRIFLSRRGSYNLRCNAAAIAVNTSGEHLLHVYKNISSKDPGVYCKTIVNLRNKKREYTTKQKQKFRAHKKKHVTVLKKITEVEYGPNRVLQEPLLNDAEIKEIKVKYYNNKVKITTEDAVKLENTRGQRSNAVWYSERSSRLTASQFGIICRMRATTNKHVYTERLLEKKFKGNCNTQYGIEKEPLAIMDFEKKFKKTVRESGLWVRPDFPYFGASPDGIVQNENAIVEVKCPASASKITPEEGIQQKKIKFGELNGTIFKLKKTHPYYYQVQGQLQISNKEKCYFILWTPKGMLVDEIIKDDLFWKKEMLDKLNSFYFSFLLPKLAVRNLYGRS